MIDQPMPKKHKQRPPYIVWSPDGPTPPRVQHKTHGGALFAATQMAKLNPGQTFYVMERASKPIAQPIQEAVPTFEARED